MDSFLNGLQMAAFCVIQYVANIFGHGTLSLPLNIYHITASDRVFLQVLGPKGCVNH